MLYMCESFFTQSTQRDPVYLLFTVHMLLQLQDVSYFSLTMF